MRGSDDVRERLNKKIWSFRVVFTDEFFTVRNVNERKFSR